MRRVGGCFGMGRCCGVVGEEGGNACEEEGEKKERCCCYCCARMSCCGLGIKRTSKSTVRPPPDHTFSHLAAVCCSGHALLASTVALPAKSSPHRAPFLSSSSSSSSHSLRERKRGGSDGGVDGGGVCFCTAGQGWVGVQKGFEARELHRGG